MVPVFVHSRHLNRDRKIPASDIKQAKDNKAQVSKSKVVGMTRMPTVDFSAKGRQRRNGLGEFNYSPISRRRSIHENTRAPTSTHEIKIHRDKCIEIINVMHAPSTALCTHEKEKEASGSCRQGVKPKERICKKGGTRGKEKEANAEDIGAVSKDGNSQNGMMGFMSNTILLLTSNPPSERHIRDFPCQYGRGGETRTRCIPSPSQPPWQRQGQFQHVSRAIMDRLSRCGQAREG
jgi:hypothetical protein